MAFWGIRLHVQIHKQARNTKEASEYLGRSSDCSHVCKELLS